VPESPARPCAACDDGEYLPPGRDTVGGLTVAVSESDTAGRGVVAVRGEDTMRGGAEAVRRDIMGGTTIAAIGGDTVGGHTAAEQLNTVGRHTAAGQLNTVGGHTAVEQLNTAGGHTERTPAGLVAGAAATVVLRGAPLSEEILRETLGKVYIIMNIYSFMCTHIYRYVYMCVCVCPYIFG